MGLPPSPPTPTPTPTPKRKQKPARSTHQRRMARSKSKGRGSSRSKKSASSAGPIDLSDPNMNSAVTLALVMVAGYYDSGFSNLPFQNNGTSWSDEVQNSLQFVNGKGTGSAIHETYWPFSLLLTLHVLNSV